MKSLQRPLLLLVVLLSGGALGLGMWLTTRSLEEARDREGEEPHAARTLLFDEAASSGGAVSPDLSTAYLEALEEQLQRPGAFENEALLTFPDEASLEDIYVRMESVPS